MAEIRTEVTWIRRWMVGNGLPVGTMVSGESMGTIHWTKTLEHPCGLGTESMSGE